MWRFFLMILLFLKIFFHSIIAHKAKENLPLLPPWHFIPNFIKMLLTIYFFIRVRVIFSKKWWSNFRKRERRGNFFLSLYFSWLISLNYFLKNDEFLPQHSIFFHFLFAFPFLSFNPPSLLTHPPKTFFIFFSSLTHQPPPPPPHTTRLSHSCHIFFLFM